MKDKLKEIAEHVNRRYENITVEELILLGMQIVGNNQTICLTSNLKLEKQDSYYILGLYEEFADYGAKPIKIWVISERLKEYQLQR